MITDNNFKFTVNISIDAYRDKQAAKDAASTEELAKSHGFKRKMSFAEQTIDLWDFDRLITSGHSYCGGLFRIDPSHKEKFETKKGKVYESFPYYKNKEKSLKMQFKADRFFTCGQVISIDIDGTRYNDPMKYANCLTLQPTYAYTSYSDDPNGLRKFRLVYVMDKLLGRDEYEFATKAIHRQAEIDTIEKLKDDCGKRFSQYFNGTYGRFNSWASYNVYSMTDLMPIVEREGIELDERAKKDGMFDDCMVADMSNLSYDRFMHFYSWKYKYFWNSVQFDGSWGIEPYKAIDPKKDVVLLFRWKANGEVDKFCDGEGRRKHLQKYAALRRLAKPDITPDELLFNLYVDRERFFDNSDDAITLDCLQRKVEIAFDLSLDELREKYQSIIDNCPTKFVLNPSMPSYMKRSAINKAKKETGWEKIASLYDTQKSVKENLAIMKGAGLDVCQRTLYNYCKENGIATNPKDQRNQKILSLYDKSQSLRANVTIMQNAGIKIGKSALAKLISEGDSF